MKQMAARCCNLAICYKNIVFDDIKYRFKRCISVRETHEMVQLDDSRMLVNLKDNGICKELSLHKAREIYSTEFLKQFLVEDDIVLDIGANIGYYVLLESKVAFKGKVIAVEPIPTNIELLQRNVQLNDCPNVAVFMCAIGDQNELKTMYVYDRCNWCSFEKHFDSKIIKEVDVPLKTLDSFLDEISINPTFIRMDVEGYEYNILRAASRVLNSGKLKMNIEIHPHLMTKSNLLEILETLETKNFTVNAIYIEPKPYNYKDINTLNYLRNIIGLPQYGFGGNTYAELKGLLNNGFTCNVFFEKG